MKLKIACVAVTAVLVVTGCGTAPSKLNQPKLATLIELQKDVAFTSHGSFGVVVEFSVLAGTYVARYEDSEGVYHHGPQACYRHKVIEPGGVYVAESKGKFAHQSDCGIYIPNDAKLPPKIYIVLGTNRGFIARTADPLPEIPTQATSDMVNSRPGMANPTNTQIAADAAGSAIGIALMSAAVEIERGRLQIISQPPDGAMLRAAVQVKTP